MSSKIPAGDFSRWLHDTELSFESGEDGPPVPCGDCNACCRSSMFIHIEPIEKQTIRRIPSGILFEAPGIAEGHLIMGYDEQGRCPMLNARNCSIYKDRPRACRNYDCRVFAATGIAVDGHSQPDIAARVSAWKFEYRTAESGREQTRLLAAGHFLQTRTDLFPPGILPSQPGPLAAIAIHVRHLFDGRPESAIAKAILEERSFPDCQSTVHPPPTTI